MNIGQFQRRDANEAEIIEALRRAGVWVRQMHSSAGFDLLCAWNGEIHVVEVKQHGGKLTADELKVYEAFHLIGCAYYVVHNADEALAIFGII